MHELFKEEKLVTYKIWPSVQQKKTRYGHTRVYSCIYTNTNTERKKKKKN